MNPDSASAAALDAGVDQGDCESRYEGELREQVMQIDSNKHHKYNFFVLGSISSYC